MRFLVAFLAKFVIVLGNIMVIRMRSTRSHTKNRRSHHALKEDVLTKCTNCSALRRPHHMCLECGYYNGKKVLDLEGEKVKRDARIQAKKDLIKLEDAEAPASDVPEAPEATEKIEAKNDSKEAKEENLADKKPEKKVE